MHWGAWATQAAPRSSRQSELVAVLPIVTHTPTPPRVAFCPSPYGRLLAPNSASFPYVDFYTGGRLAMGGTAIGREASCVVT
jgi:hypothetical protein